jgi:natural product precursor
MKKKMKSLKLNRETIARLDSEKLAEAKGGLYVGEEEKCTGCPSGCGIFPDEQIGQ